ncbi:MAG: S26 family signal peptidase [Planctomycetaceae bacterium]|jgi:signal peptidase I|nr:S26 family signal peptidase [Planctomycetaceae bacterium]
MEGIFVPLYVSSNSMSPTLMGPHWELICPECLATFRVALQNTNNGFGETSRRKPSGETLLARGICPTCGFAETPVFSNSFRSGERLRIHRAATSLRTIRRWDVVVFRKPDDAQLAVKRVVATPNETIKIERGDIFINGKIAVKPYAVQREMRIPAPYCQWKLQNENELVCLPIRPTPHFQGEKQSANATKKNDPALNPSLFGATNQLCENQNQTQRSENVFRVHDLALELDWTPENNKISLPLRIQANIPSRSFVAIFDRKKKTATVEDQRQKSIYPILSGAGVWKIETSLFDRQFLIAVNGIVVAEIPFEEEINLPGKPEIFSPFTIQWKSDRSEISAKEYEMTTVRQIRNLRVWRDVYYTTSPDTVVHSASNLSSQTTTVPQNCYYLLGDNSAFSLDARVWKPPCVPFRQLTGIARFVK